MLSSAGACFANGAFPAVSQLVVDPSDEQHLALRANFGLLTTRNGGQSWNWTCEAALGYANIEPPLAMLASGTLLLGLPTGVRVGDGSGCTFTDAAGIAQHNVVDLSGERAMPGAALAISVDLEAVMSQVWESTDEGQTWAPLGEPFAAFTALTIDAAKTDTETLYVSGTDRQNPSAPHGVLMASKDHGKTWLPMDVPETNAIMQPYIAGLDPEDAETVYVRLTGVPGQLLVTHDAGESFVTALTLPSPVEGFTISPDGATLMAGSVNDGLYRGSAETLEFERLSCEGLSSLSWSSAGLVGCGAQTINGFGLGRSVDQGESFSVFLDLLCLNGSSECGAETPAGTQCPALWPAIAEAVGQNDAACDPDAQARPLDKSCLPGEGAAGQSSTEGGAPADSGGATAEMPAGGAASGAPTEAGGAPADSGGEPGRPSSATDETSGCGCRVAQQPHGVSWLALGGAALLVSRRRRAGRSLLSLLALLSVLGCGSQPPSKIDDAYEGTAFPEQRPLLELPDTDFGLTSNNGSDSVSLLALAAESVLTTSPIGVDPVALDGPHHIAVSRELGAAFVALSYPAPAVAPGPHAAHGSSQRAGRVQRLGLDRLAPEADTEVETNPGDIVLSEDGTRLVVSHFDLVRAMRETKLQEQRADLALLDPSDLQAGPSYVRTCVAPHGVALSRPSGDLAFVACYGEDALAIVDTSAPDATPELFSIGPGGKPGRPYYGPYAAVLSSDGQRLAISNTESSDVRFFDVNERTFLEQVVVTPGKPYFAAWSAGDEQLFIPTQNPDAIVVVDPTSGVVQKTHTFDVSECQLPHELVLASDDSALFVVCEGDHVAPSVVLALDPSSLETLTTYPVGVYPDRLALARGKR